MESIAPCRDAANCNQSNFLEAVLPPFGHAVLAYKWHGRRHPWTSASYNLSEQDAHLQLSIDATLKAGSAMLRAGGKPAAQTYFETATQLDPIKSPKRGSAKTTAGVACLALDIDCFPKRSDYPPKQTAIETLDRLLSPSILVDSGNGLHAYWLLDQPIEFRSDADRQEYQEMLSLWEATVAYEFAQHGYYLDPGQSRVSRLLRLPGTWNIGAHAPVEVIGGDWSRHNRQIFQELSAQQDRAFSQIHAQPAASKTQLHTMGMGGVEGEYVYPEIPLDRNTKSPLSTVSSISVDNVKAVFVRNLPSVFGERHQCLKRIVCTLKADENLRAEPAQQFRQLFLKWHELAEPNIRTKDIEQNWDDFCDLWESIKYGYAASSGKKPLSHYFGTDNNGDREMLRAGIKEMGADYGETPFALDGRSVAQFFPKSHRTIAYWIKDLVKEGFLEVVREGMRGRAAEYRLAQT